MPKTVPMLFEVIIHPLMYTATVRIPLLSCGLWYWKSTFSIFLTLNKRIIIIIILYFCRESQQHSVPYHYYEPRGPDECAMYISHERGRRGSHHRFITEKRVFAKWARTFDIHFYQPDWTPPPLPTNQTLEATATAAPLVPQKTWPVLGGRKIL